MSERFNYVSNWITTELCCCENFKQRVKLFETFLFIADHLRYQKTERKKEQDKKNRVKNEKRKKKRKKNEKKKAKKIKN